MKIDISSEMLLAEIKEKIAPAIETGVLDPKILENFAKNELESKIDECTHEFSASDWHLGEFEIANHIMIILNKEDILCHLMASFILPYFAIEWNVLEIGDEGKKEYKLYDQLPAHKLAKKAEEHLDDVIEIF